jgi:hypothetical protein
MSTATGILGIEIPYVHKRTESTAIQSYADAWKISHDKEPAVNCDSNPHKDGLLS